ncbi:MAG: DUF3857 domain-containing protein [Flavobacteriaceae bacterium]|nr:DUF3857 domain-containing protein [Flavobacteriaceae bacterium]
MRKFLTIFCLIIFSFSNVIAQENYEQFWDHLLNNDREAAAKELQKNKKSGSMEALVLNEILRVETGQLKTNDDFLKGFLVKPDFEHYLYALWNQAYVFDTYIDTGLNNRNSGRLKTVAKATINNTTVKDAITYLNSVVARNSNDWQAYFDLNEKIDVIKDWQYCGVFENLNESGLDRFYMPEKMAMSAEPFDAKSNGLVNWYVSKNNKEAYQFFTNHEEYGSGVNYAQTFISSETDQKVHFRIGCGSAFKLWLNDVLIYENPEDVTTDMNAYNVSVNLPKGNNRLLLKTAESSYGSYFIIAALDENGQAKTNLSYSSAYSDYNKSTKEQIQAKPLNNEFEVFFENKLKNHPNNFFYAYCLSNAYMRSSKHEEAKIVLTPFYEKYPKSSLIRKMLTGVYSLEGDEATVKELADNIELEDPNYYLPLVLKIADYQALQRMSLDELDSFLNKFKKAFDLEVFNITADFMYNARQEDRVKLKRNLNDLIRVAQGNTRLLLRYIPLYSILYEDDDTTIKLLEDLNDDHFEYAAVKSLARYYEKQNKKDKVLKLLTKDMSHMQEDNLYLKAIIDKLHNYQEHKKSLEYIDMALDNFPYSFQMMELKGDALLQLDRKKEAIDFYERSLTHNSAHKSLRKKIRDLKNEPNLLNELVLEEAYDFIKEKRGTITENNYGFNILLDDVNYELYGEGGGRYRFVYIYEITSDNGVETFKEYDLGLSGGYDIIKSELVKKDGSIVPAEKSGSSFVFSGLSIGDVIYIDYESSFSSVGRFYRDFSDKYQFEAFHPTVESTMQVLAPKSMNLKYASLNGTLEPKITEKGDMKLYEWSMLDFKGLPQGESYMPNSVDVANYLHVSTIKDWNEISSWYSDLVRSRIEVNSTVEKVFSDLFPNGHKQLSEEERVKIIYNYIRNNFNYSYVSFRQSGFVPQKPSKTIKTSLGDCKDFSTLFVTLANLAELDSNLVLILTSDYGQNELVLPSTDFNHCIAKVKIDGEEQFLELTDKYLPFRALPRSLAGATALEIPFNSDTDKTFDLFKLTDVKREKAVFTNNAVIKVSPSHMDIEMATEFKGHINSYYAGLLSEPNFEVKKQAIDEDLQGRISESFVLEDVTNIERLDDDRIIKFTTHLKIDKKVNKIGGLHVIQLPIVSRPYTSDIISEEDRNYPIEYLNYENVDVYVTTYDIIIEEGQAFSEIPEDASFSFKDHSYSISYKQVKPNHLKVEVNSTPSISNINPEDYEAFKTYVKNVLEVESAFIGYK